MKRLLAALLIGLAVPAAHAAECVGSNLLNALPEADRAAIRSATEAVPYHQGTLWQASKDKARITMVGTYHFDDPRHAATRARLAPLIAEADALLVELGPEEEAELKAAMLADPTLMMDPTGPTLPERLDPEDWKAVSAALADRGIPAIMAAKMRPWYVSMMMGMSPCVLQQVAKAGDANGLDWQLMAEAEKAVKAEEEEPADEDTKAPVEDEAEKPTEGEAEKAVKAEEEEPAEEEAKPPVEDEAEKAEKDESEKDKSEKKVEATKS